jgi:D-2-hydroxyacid dehydrogenase (NADP+)
VANLLKALGMPVIGTSRTPRAVEGFDRVEHTAKLAELARDADYLVNILPSNRENRDLFGASVFAAMKKSAYFVNVGRGDTVNEQALIAALREGRIAGAGLDVFRAHPLAADSPLWDMPNVIVCPTDRRVLPRIRGVCAPDHQREHGSVSGRQIRRDA